MKKITILILASSLIGAFAHAKDPVPTPVKKGVFKTWYKDSAVSVEVSRANGPVSCSIYAQKLTDLNLKKS